MSTSSLKLSCSRPNSKGSLVPCHPGTERKKSTASGCGRHPRVLWPRPTRLNTIIQREDRTTMPHPSTRYANKQRRNIMNRHSTFTSPGEENFSNGTSRCPACRTVGYQGDHYCPQCGREMTHNCQNCGAPIEHAIAYFCTKCGSDFTASIGSESRSRGLALPPPPSGSSQGWS